MSPVFIDISEFIKSPARTGIQRVVREILSHWPSAHPLVPVELDPATLEMVRVDPQALQRALDFAADPDAELAAVQWEMAQRRRDGARPRLGTAPLLMPELFFDHTRCRFYRRGGVRSAFIIFDFLPWLHPEIFGFTSAEPMNMFLLTAMGASRRAFISPRVRDAYFERIGRARPGDDRAIDLGADGLRLARGAAAKGPLGDYLLCFGALDGRKRQDLVLDAFLRSDASRKLRMVFAGRIPAKPSPAMQALIGCTHASVSVIDDPGDSELAGLVAGARAVVFTSEMEGYGLPATEALYAGVPVVVAADLPSLAGRSPAGQIRLKAPDADSIAEAMNQLADDRRASALRLATREVELATWADYARSVAEWAAQGWDDPPRALTR